MNRWLRWLAIALLMIVVIGGILNGYSVAWTGFGDYTAPDDKYVRGKTLWDWMELFIIPIFLALGAFYLNRSERDSERRRAEERTILERQTAEDRAKLEREIATDRQQEAALQSYLDRMADLLLREKLRVSKKAEVRDVARIWTLTILRELDGRRKGLVLLFLQESGLIGEKSVIDLTGADLSLADLYRARLAGTDLKEANLRFSILSGANLTKANLTEAELFKAYLIGADLSGASLSGANLTQADLTGAEVSDEQLATAKSLAGAIMPDGTKHD